MPLTEEQLKKRLTGITASEIGAVCGVNPYKSPIQVWRDKLNPPPQFQNDNTIRGNLNEGIIAEKYCVKFNCVAMECPTVTCDKNPIIIATPDRIICDDIGDPYLLEIKSSKKHMKKIWGDLNEYLGIPPYYYLQVLWQLIATDLDYAEIAVEFDDGDMRVFPIFRSTGQEPRTIDCAMKFWNEYVLPRKEPPKNFGW